MLLPSSPALVLRTHKPCLSGQLVFTKPVYSGKIYSTVSPTLPGKCIATIRPGVIGLGRPEPNRRAEIVSIPVGLSTDRIRTHLIGIEKIRPEEIDLTEADVIVAGGRGTNRNWRLIEALAEVLGGVVGGSRMAIDDGHIGRERMVGQSGKAVAPKLYVAIGISGASHQVAGIRDARVIVAINPDPTAPISKLADLVLKCNAETVVPEIVKLLAPPQPKF